MSDSGWNLSYQTGSVNWDGKSISALPPEQISEGFHRLKKAGISEVMLTGYHHEEPVSFDMEAETQRIGRELASLGMKGAQHHSMSSTFAKVGESQKAVVDHLKKIVDYTANLHTDVVVIHPSRPQGHYVSMADERRAFAEERLRVGLEAILDTCAANLHEAGKYAQDKNVLIALENLDRFVPSATLADLPRLIEAADSPAVGLCLDSGHAWCGGTDPVLWVDRMKDKLFTTHFHDNHGLSNKAVSTVDGFLEPPPIDEHLPPGFGTIDWVSLIAALRRNHYARTVNFEYSGEWPGMSFGAGVAHSIRFWRTCEYLEAHPRYH